ncbi:MAG: dihydrofolate reductase, partial [Pseudolabrys sp.]
MGRVRVAGFSLSLDGFGAGLEQSLQDPLGKRGTELHRW